MNSYGDSVYLEKILALSFVKEALYQIVFKKLFIDGYVYCDDSLCPNTKEQLKKQIRNSPFKPILERNNPSSYSEVLNYFSGIRLESESQIILTRAECQSIFYVLMSPEKKENYPAFLLFSLQKLYSNLTYYSQDGAFIKHDYVQLIEISSLERFIAEISELPDNVNFFGRGHTNINYTSFPSLFREKRLYKNEYMMYQELVVRCPHSFAHCSSHLDFLVEMQHYGLPTRLLDITSNPLISLYFACEKGEAPGEVLIYEVHNKDLKYDKCDEVAILSSLPMLTFKKQKALLNLLKKHGLLTGPEYEEFTCEVQSERPAFRGNLSLERIIDPVFVKPIRNNQRIAHQEGAFIIWGLDESFYSDDRQADNSKLRANDYRYFKNGQKIVFYIPAPKKKKILAGLNRIGINRAYVYPEIDDVAEYIKSSMIET